MVSAEVEQALYLGCSFAVKKLAICLLKNKRTNS